ncbi:unnamed protein product [Citrullus colocynthis]|uniref:Uncharacterized protein n=1 Tax=Citrullus colocynthis TaxID=252529 RepID=A0ABP0ZCT5_9ROSI
MELEDEADSLSFPIPFNLKNMSAHSLDSSSSSQLVGDYNGAPTWRGRDGGSLGGCDTRTHLVSLQMVESEDS